MRTRNAKRDKAVMALREKGLSYREIGKLLNVNASTAMRAVHKGVALYPQGTLDKDNKVLHNNISEG